MTLTILVSALLTGADGEVRTVKGHGSSVMSVAFSPDGKVLASGSGGPESLVWLWPVTRR